MLPKAKKKIFTKWLTDEALNLTDERREAKKKGNDEEYRRWEAGKQHCMGERGRTGAEYTITMQANRRMQQAGEKQDILKRSQGPSLQDVQPCNPAPGR